MKLTTPKLLFAFAFAIIFINQSFAQSRITGVVKGLADKDSAIVRIQKSTDEFLFKKIGGNPSKIDVPFDFPGIANGKWALSIDAKGYLFPVAKVIDLNGNTSENIITLTPAPADSNFFFTWRDDSSYVGHAQQAYINEQVVVNVLGKAEKVPDEFNAINLYLQYGFLLSNEESTWTSEDAYRLYTTIKKLNFPVFGENQQVVVKTKWIITDKFVDRDLEFTRIGDVDVVRISRAAFTYASPLVVTVDGIKGKFFSKRLFKSIVYYYTDKGTSFRIDELARSRYGFEFLSPGSLLESQVKETASNFQDFNADEKINVISMIEEFPDALQKQEQLKYMIRRINGQPILSCPGCSAVASGNHIEYSEGAFASDNIEFTQRLILHEKAHFLWAYTFDSTTKKDWTDLGGWFLDPTSPSGWSTSNTTEFVSGYAHLKNPNEDMAESIAWYITNPEGLRSRSLRKFEFIRDRIMKGTRYISVIRPDLTFQVYNLFPDYYYPGKIIRTKIDVIGGPNEDKKVVIEIELHTEGDAKKGAKHAALTLMSSIGTFIGFGLSPINADGSILRGERILPKTAKSGYWVANQIALYDEQNNARWENTSTYGFKCFLNNPLEDIEPPLYIQGTLKMNLVKEKFSQLAGSPASKLCGSCADTLTPIQAIKLDINVFENKTISPNGRIYFNMFYPTIDSTNKYNIEPGSRAAAAGNELILNDFPDSIKSIDLYFPIPDFYPSGYYSIPNFFMADNAGNHRNVFLDLDTANKNYFIPGTIHQRGIRDSIYVKTAFPDYKPPIIDLNDIKIQATPTNPEAPNGETLFEMWLWIKDESDFAGKESGIYYGDFTLRDPQGNFHNIPMNDGLGDTNKDFLTPPPSTSFVRYYFKTLLPKGSPPGLWGVSSMNLTDRALNRKNYNFVEIVRFDVDESKQLRVTPFVEILDKKINAKNADSVSVLLGCKSCKDQNYRLRVYSSMGGNSVVFEGKMAKDTIQLTNLKISGVNDGILYASVFMLDSSLALIGTGRAVYTKDTQIPKSEQLKMNLANFGKSNLDSLIIDIKTTEKNGTYNLVAVQSSVTAGSAASNIGSMMTLASGTIGSIGDSLVLSGSFTNGTFQIPGSLIKSMLDGVIELRFYLIDSVGNIGEPIKTTVYKDTKDPVATIKKASETGLNTVVNLTMNEFISNTLGVQSFKVVNATIQAVEKIDSKNFKITLKRICADTLKIELPAGLLTDTVGNLNQVTSFQAIDNLVPALPTVTSLSYCQGATSNALSATAGAGNTLLWYGSNATGGDPINTAPTPTTSIVGTTNFYVTQRNNETQCESQRAVIAVVVNAIPQKPTVTRDANANLVSSASAGNQWYKEGVSIQGATAVSYKPTDVAYYSVSSTVNGCAGPQSENYYYLSTSVLDFTNGEFVKFFPNPIVSSVRLNYRINGIQQVELKILDQSGKQVKIFNKIKNGTALTLDGLKSGVYYIIISTKEKGLIYSQSLIKQ